MSAPTGGPSLSQTPNLVTNSNNPSNQQPTLFPLSAKPQIPPPQRRQLDDPSNSFITRIVQTVTLVHYIDGDGNPRGMSTFYATPQTVLADPVTGDVIGPVDNDSPVAAENAGAAEAAQPGIGPGDTNGGSANSPGNLEDPAAANAPAAVAAANADVADANPLQAADDSGEPAPVGEDPGAANRDPPGDAVVHVAPPPGDAVAEAAPAPGVPEAPQPPGAPETAEAGVPPEAEAGGAGGASPAPEAPVAPGAEQQPEATAPPLPAPATDTNSPDNTALSDATGTSEDQTLASSLSDISSSLSSSASTTQSTNSATPTNSVEADSANSDGDDGTPTGAIVGGVVGGVLGAALLLLLIFLLLRWRKKKAGQLRLEDAAGAGAAATRGGLAAGGEDNDNRGGGAAGEMAEKSPSSPSSTGGGVLAAMATLNRSRSSPSGSQKSTERGFYRVSGKKLPSVMHHGGDGYSDPRRHSTISGASSGNTDSHGLEVDPGAAPKLALGQPMRPVSGVPVIRSSPARTPVEVEDGNPFSNPFDDPPPGLTADGVGRSLGAQDMSRGSRGSSSKFMEDL